MQALARYQAKETIANHSALCGDIANEIIVAEQSELLQILQEQLQQLTPGTLADRPVTRLSRTTTFL
jgi:hypothetical protein